MMRWNVFSSSSQKSDVLFQDSQKVPDLELATALRYIRW